MLPAQQAVKAFDAYRDAQYPSQDEDFERGLYLDLPQECNQRQQTGQCTGP